MDRILLSAALRVLSGLTCGPRPSASDIDSVSGSALPDEGDLYLDDLGRRVAERFMSSRRQIPMLQPSEGERRRVQNIGHNVEPANGPPQRMGHLPSGAQ